MLYLRIAIIWSRSKLPYDNYKETYAELYKDRDDKFVCLMDLALMAMKKLKKEGKLADQEESDEINACSIVVPLEVDGKTEEWLVNFKTRHTSIRQRSSRLVALQLVLVEQSVIRCPDVLMFTKLCVSQVPLIRRFL